jgi:hypothetical protein
MLRGWFCYFKLPSLILSSWFMVYSSRFKVHGSRFMVQGSRFMVHGSGMRAWNGCHGNRFSATQAATEDGPMLQVISMGGKMVFVGPGSVPAGFINLFGKASCI